MGKIGSKEKQDNFDESDPKMKKKFLFQEKPILKTLLFSRKLDNMLTKKDLKSPLLQAAFAKNVNGVLEYLEALKQSNNVKQYEHDLTLVFWFVVHLEDLNIASALIENEFLLKQLVACALMNKRGEGMDSENDESENSEEDEEGPENREEWNIGSGRRSEESFKSHNLSEEEESKDNKGKNKQFEGGDKSDEEDDFFSEQDDHEHVNPDFQHRNIPSPMSAQNQQIKMQSPSNAYNSQFQIPTPNSAKNQQSKPQNFQQQSTLFQQRQQQQYHQELLFPQPQIKTQENNTSNNRPPSRPGSRPSSSRQNMHEQETVSASAPVADMTLDTKPKEEPTEKKQSLGEMLKEMKRKKVEEEEAKLREEEALNSQAALEAIGINKDMIENTTLENIQQLLEVKMSFRQRFQNLMTNVLKIALQKEEEKLACVITAYYEIAIEEEMIIRAINSGNYKFLFFVWAFEKNYIGSRFRNGEYISFQHLFYLILQNHDDDVKLGKAKCAEVCDWQIISTENILKSLVSINLDEVAIKYMGFYSHFLDKDLFIHSMTHGNTYFLQNALIMAAFDKMIFREEVVIDKILTTLKEGYRTNFLMNILSLVDISVWKNKHFKELVEIINDYVEENYDKNRLLLSPNPVMSIALACELLTKVAKARRKFENECFKIQKCLLQLGKMYLAKIEDEKFYETLIMGKDFKQRTVLKIITQNAFEPLMDQDDPKAENLMVMIWHGKEATKCDGNIYGYSNLAHIIKTRAKKISGKKTSIIQTITNYFEPNFRVDYSFQYRYRTKAVSFYFYKEFFCALAMLVIFQYINYRYLILFSSNYIYSEDCEDCDITSQNNQKLNRVINSLREYVDWNFYALFFSVALLFQLLLKIFFNICGKKKIGIDKWTFMDSLSAILNIAAVQVVQKTPAENYLNPTIKDAVDYFMIAVLCICWLRFFAYFLVVRSISKLLLTLIAMIGDTINFMFIVCCFLLIMSSVFTTLYQDTNPEKYGGLAITVRYLFDAVIGQYDYSDMGSREVSHSILLMAHVFFSNILLLNYLIAILSTTYDNMRETGIFKYKVNLYQYCERFMIAFEDRSYGEIILHPPPLSYLSTLMVPFLISPYIMKTVSRGFSYLMYWLENLLFVAVFALFEFCMAPVAYVKVWFNILKNSMGVLKTIGNCIIWLLIGFIMIVFLFLRDIFYLIKILCYHQGCRIGKIDELADFVEPLEVRTRVYNETRATVISLYQRLQKHMNQDGAEEDDEDDTQDDVENEYDFFHIEDDDNMNEDFLYVVKKSLIIEEWKKRRLQLEKYRRKREQENEGLGLKKVLANSFKKRFVEDNGEGKKSWNIRQSINNQVKKNQQGKKAKDIMSHLKIIFLEALKKNNNNDEEEDIDVSDYVIPDNEILLVDQFLTKYTIVSESSMNEHLDIMLMLKALPNKLMPHTLEQTEMFNFRIFQESLIAYQNIDLVNAFEYIDDKNRERIQNVKEKLINQKGNLQDVKDILELVKSKIEKNEDHFSKQRGISSAN